MDTSKLKDLPSDTRQRVEEALKKTLESELANVEGDALAAAKPAAFSRSRGAIFSRSKTSKVLREESQELVDTQIVKTMESMDEAAFNKFADRLATLKKLSRE